MQMVIQPLLKQTTVNYKKAMNIYIVQKVEKRAYLTQHSPAFVFPSTGDIKQSGPFFNVETAGRLNFTLSPL